MSNLGADVPSAVDNQWGRGSQDIDFAVRKLFAPSLGTYVAKRAAARIRFGARARRRLFSAEVYWRVRS